MPDLPTSARGLPPTFIWFAPIAFLLSALATFEAALSTGLHAPPMGGFIATVLLVLHVTPLIALRRRYRTVRIWHATLASALLGSAGMLAMSQVPSLGLGFGFTPVATVVVYEALRRFIAQAPRG